MQVQLSGECQQVYKGRVLKEQHMSDIPQCREKTAGDRLRQDNGDPDEICVAVQCSLDETSLGSSYRPVHYLPFYLTSSSPLFRGECASEER